MQGRKEYAVQPDTSVPRQGVIDEDLIQSRETGGNLSGFSNPPFLPSLQFIKQLLLGWCIDGEENEVCQLLCKSLHMGESTEKWITEM